MLRNATKPLYNAIIINAITHRSVLLSINNKNAHIPLESHNISKSRHSQKIRKDQSEDFLNLDFIYHISSEISPSQKIRTKTQLQKLSEIHIVSTEIHKIPQVGVNKLNQNAINAYHN